MEQQEKDHHDGVTVSPNATGRQITHLVTQALLLAGRDDDAQAFTHRAMERRDDRDAIIALAKEYVRIAFREFLIASQEPTYYLPGTVFPEIEEPRLTIDGLLAWLATRPDRVFVWGFTNTDPLLCFLTDVCGWPKAMYHLTNPDAGTMSVMVGTPVENSGNWQLWNLSIVKTPAWVRVFIADLRDAAQYHLPCGLDGSTAIQDGQDLRGDHLIELLHDIQQRVHTVEREGGETHA